MEKSVFNTCIGIEVEILLGMCLIDHTIINVYPLVKLEKPMEALPLFVAAMQNDTFFESASSVEIELKD